jgi:preprotein translocase subunit SecD
MSSPNKNRVLTFLGVIFVAFIFLLPTIFPTTFKDVNWISKQIALGLDLSGGVHLVYEVETEEAVQTRLQSVANGIRSSLRADKVAVRRARVTDGGDLEITLLRADHSQKLKDLVTKDYSDLILLNEEAVGSGAKLLFNFSEPKKAEIERSAVTQSIETLRNRVDAFGVSEPTIQKTGEKRIILQMPGVDDIESVKRVVGSVAKLEFRFLPNSQTSKYQVFMEDRDGGGKIAVEDEVQMTGDAVDDAQASFNTGQVEVTLILTTEGARTFRKVTTEGVGREMAIILDGQVYSAPRIQEPIGGGRASITGSFTLKEADELAVVLRAGALPAPLTVMEERTVGPTLGKESIVRGVEAILLGFALIIVFMVIYYGKSGVVAVGSLALNLVLVMAALSAFGATLTLPGLAGLALTVGMAVDANVIIFERIREEIRNGSGRDAAVHSGFDKAFSAIMDANVTTLLTGLILYYFGTGPIRGFAVTLSVGIITTLYCATFVTRLAFDLFELKGRKVLSI